MSNSPMKLRMEPESATDVLQVRGTCFCRHVRITKFTIAENNISPLQESIAITEGDWAFRLTSSAMLVSRSTSLEKCGHWELFEHLKRSYFSDGNIDCILTLCKIDLWLTCRSYSAVLRLRSPHVLFSSPTSNLGPWINCVHPRIVFSLRPIFPQLL